MSITVNLKGIQPTESHRVSRAKKDIVLFCSACGKDLMVIIAGNTCFTQTHGQCSCSWVCCEAVLPGNNAHQRHLAHRNICPDEILPECDPETGWFSERLVQ